MQMDDRDCPPDETENRQRTRYSAGTLLTAEDFEREQEYHRAALRRHNLALHGWGVARGLEVTQSPSAGAAILVTPGYALDPCGREILLTDPVIVPIAAGCSASTDRLGPSERISRRSGSSSGGAG
jgi:hypothetical protein